MNIQTTARFVLILTSVFILGVPVASQSLTRNLSKTVTVPFGAGGTLNLIGAPAGAVTIEGSNRQDVEITAKIELTGSTEAELDRLAQVTSFAVEEGTARMTIRSIGTHNRLGDKKFWKKFPKELLTRPFRIDYSLKVPFYLDLNISGGDGDLSLKGVEGTIRTTFARSDARITLVGGTLNVAIDAGKLELVFPERNWRSGMIEASVANGDITAKVPSALNAELTAAIAGSGKIDNRLASLKPRSANVPFTERSVIAKAGVGGPPVRFSVGSGNIELIPIEK
ncbi:MAG: hypothetical protein HS105_03875 [Chloracidobacterium sp.]|nr:hypothetical protein [Chloracidobacterium sp.]